MLTYRTGTGGSARSMAEYLAAMLDVAELALSNTFGSNTTSIEPGRTAAIPAPDMHPLIAGLLRIDPGQALSLDQMTHLLAGRRADGKALPMGNRSIAYTDSTFSAPKSFSVALAFAPTAAERAILAECWVTANDKLMDHVGEMIGGGGHVARIRYDHYTSRPTVRLSIDGDTELLTVPSHMPGDMQRHTHNIIPHVSIDDRGKVRALPLDEIRERLHEWGAIGHAFLATELRARGIAADVDPKTGLSHLPGVPAWASELFENRSRDGERLARKYAASIGLDWDGLDVKARSSLLRSNIKATRRAKDGLADLRAWEATAEKAGYRHQSVLDGRNVQRGARRGGRARQDRLATVDHGRRDASRHGGARADPVGHRLTERRRPGHGGLPHRGRHARRQADLANLVARGGPALRQGDDGPARRSRAGGDRVAESCCGRSHGRTADGQD